MHALLNSLEFIRQNFEREVSSLAATLQFFAFPDSHILAICAQQGERNYIMQVVCESTQSTTTEVQVAGFECLVRIMQLYYDKMRFYMEKALFGVCASGAGACELPSLLTKLTRAFPSSRSAA